VLDSFFAPLEKPEEVEPDDSVDELELATDSSAKEEEVILTEALPGFLGRTKAKNFLFSEEGLGNKVGSGIGTRIERLWPLRRKWNPFGSGNWNCETRTLWGLLGAGKKFPEFPTEPWLGEWVSPLFGNGIGTRGSLGKTFPSNPQGPRWGRRASLRAGVGNERKGPILAARGRPP